MPTTYHVLETIESVRALQESYNWSAYARFSDRQDSPIYDASGVRMKDGVLEVNAGEWHHARGYLNEEWLKPEFVYMKHCCDGCHYPPDMCCLQRQPRYEYDSFYEVVDFDNFDDDYGDDYEQAIEQLHRWPEGVTTRTIEA